LKILKEILKYFFVAGDRVRKMLENSFNLQRQIQSQLASPSSEIVERVNDLIKAKDTSVKKVKSLMEEIGYLQGTQYYNSIQKGEIRFVCHHREDGTPDYLNAFLKGLSQVSSSTKKMPKLEFQFLVFLTIGDEKGGNLILCGPTIELEIVVPKITEIIEAKGKIVNGEFRAKFQTCKNITIAQKFIEEYI